MKKLAVIIVLFFALAQVNAQYGGTYYRQSPYRRPVRRKQVDDGFKPTVNLTLGYGFPNLDKDQLLIFDNAYAGTNSQNGPFMGTLDYQFKRNTSIGIMVTNGSVNRNYYNYSNDAYAFNGKLNNTAIMLNLVNYLPGTRTVSPYFRTAIGVNIWSDNYAFPNGSKVVQDNGEQDLAYQVSLGMKLNISKNAGFFVEAGYGKYILSGGLAFKF